MSMNGCFVVTWRWLHLYLVYKVDTLSIAAFCVNGTAKLEPLTTSGETGLSVSYCSQEQKMSRTKL